MSVTTVLSKDLSATEVKSVVHRCYCVAEVMTIVTDWFEAGDKGTVPLPNCRVTHRLNCVVFNQEFYTSESQIPSPNEMGNHEKMLQVPAWDAYMTLLSFRKIFHCKNLTKPQEPKQKNKHRK